MLLKEEMFVVVGGGCFFFLSCLFSLHFKTGLRIKQSTFCQNLSKNPATYSENLNLLHWAATLQRRKEKKKKSCLPLTVNKNRIFLSFVFWKGDFGTWFTVQLWTNERGETVILQLPPQIEKQLMNTNQRYLDFCHGQESAQMNSPLKLNFENGILNVSLNFRCIVETLHFSH